MNPRSVIRVVRIHGMIRLNPVISLIIYITDKLRTVVQRAAPHV